MNNAIKFKLLYNKNSSLVKKIKLEQFRNKKVNQDIEVTSELILIARILHQRFRISNCIQVKEVK